MNFIKTLEQAIAGNDVLLARGSIITYVDNDPKKEQMIALEIADEVNHIFHEKGITFFESEDNWLKPIPREEWNPEYWNNIKAAMRMNFSREKIILATDVATYLRNQGNAKFQTSANTAGNPNMNFSHKREQQSGYTSSTSQHMNSGPSSSRRTNGSPHHRTTAGRITVKRRSESQSGLIVGGAIVVGAVVGGVVGAAIGAATAGAVVGGAVVGGVVYCKNNNRR